MTSAMKRNAKSLTRAPERGHYWQLGWTVGEARASIVKARDQGNRSATPGVYALLVGFHGR